MATDPVYSKHLEWALGFFADEARREQHRKQAKAIWKNDIPTPDQNKFRTRIESMEEAKAIGLEMADVWETHIKDRDWDSKWAPLLAKHVDELDDVEVNELAAYMRVLGAYIYAIKSYRVTLERLMQTYVDFGLEHVFAPKTDANLSAAKAGEASHVDSGQWDLVATVCTSPEFKARMKKTMDAATLSMFIDEIDEKKIWVAAIDLDEGLGKSVQLWVWLAFDERGNIVDRHVSKCEQLEEPRWSMARYWHTFGDGDFLPMESYLQRKCWAQDNTAFVNHRSYLWSEEEHWVEYRMDYCPYGDLNRLYYTYKRANLPIPEPMLWMIFQKLVEQCLIMEKGSVIANTTIPGWRQIVHRDIKPENVFVDVPSTNGFFPGYPTPKMADFGFAFETSPQDPTNPDQWSRSGTRPYLAPEQMGLSAIEDPNEPPVGVKLLAHTNIWGIGMILLRLTNGPFPLAEQKESTPIWSHINNTYILPGHSTSPWAQTHYSENLLGLIRKAIIPEPELRPTPQALLHWVVTEMGKVPGGVGDFCLAAKSGLQDPLGAAGEFACLVGRERYKIAMALEDGDEGFSLRTALEGLRV